MAKNTFTHCNCCKKHTNHLVLFSKKVKSFSSELLLEDEIELKGFETYLTVQCMGCEDISFVKRYSGDHFTNEEGKPDHIDINYPERQYASDYYLLSEEEKLALPWMLKELYEQLEIAMNYEANILVGVGLRMLVEAICIEQGINGNNLKTKIEALHQQGLISKNEAPILDKLRTIGNTSAHEIKAFSIEKLSYALEIINHVLKSIYILPRINNKLKLEDKRKATKAK